MLCYNPTMSRPVTYTTNHKYELVPYSPEWPRWYTREAALLRKIFGPLLLDIQHVGSTAIPGMVAKPQLDILIQVVDITQVDICNDAMVAAGYVAYGDALQQHGRLFSRWNNDVKIVNVHIYQPESPAVRGYIGVRDYLIAHPGEAEKYAALKRELYKKYPHDYLKYRELKDPYIDKLKQRITDRT